MPVLPAESLSALLRQHGPIGKVAADKFDSIGPVHSVFATLVDAAKDGRYIHIRMLALVDSGEVGPALHDIRVDHTDSSSLNKQPLNSKYIKTSHIVLPAARIRIVSLQEIRSADMGELLSLTLTIGLGTSCAVPPESGAERAAEQEIAALADFAAVVTALVLRLAGSEAAHG